MHVHAMALPQRRSLSALTFLAGLMTLVLAGFVTAPAATAVPAATSTTTQLNPAWGTSAPPAGATLSRAYQALLASSPSGYAPRADECSVEIHARYWTYGPDGKVYPTWHPARDASGCSFGHEHGDDPRTSVLFNEVGWPAFAYTNEVLAESAPATGHRHEDHVGHKVLAVNAVQVVQGDTGSSRHAPTGPSIATCDILLKFHQGTHSADAFTNNVHELLFSSSCRQGGQTIEVRYSALIPLGRPGGFGGTDCPGPGFGRDFTQVGPATPTTSPSDTRSLGRLLPSVACVDAIRAGGTSPQFDIFSMHEFWFSDVRLTTPTVTFRLSPLFYVLNPSRYYDPAAPGGVARTVDLCYTGIPGAFCDLTRLTTQRTGRQVTWDDVASPFKGTVREYRPGTFNVRTSGPTTVYTDPMGQNASTTAFPGSIEQHFSGSTSAPMYVRGATRNYDADRADRLRAPN